MPKSHRKQPAQITPKRGRSASKGKEEKLSLAERKANLKLLINTPVKTRASSKKHVRDTVSSKTQKPAKKYSSSKKEVSQQKSRNTSQAKDKATAKKQAQSGFEPLIGKRQHRGRSESMSQKSVKPQTKRIEREKSVQKGRSDSRKKSAAKSEAPRNKKAAIQSKKPRVIKAAAKGNQLARLIKF